MDIDLSKTLTELEDDILWLLRFGTGLIAAKLYSRVTGSPLEEARGMVEAIQGGF